MTCPLGATHKGILLMYAARPQCALNHYIRAVQPSLTLEAARKADDIFFEALALLLTVDPSEFSREDKGRWGSRRQAQLAVRDAWGLCLCVTGSSAASSLPSSDHLLTA